ncbi:hypothetical protein AOQ84DRAFT_359045 [Glonium stellatum]|uniref:Uncharacterized protein n=1 Tax=Glonium stellatum TaxID=574774 RepID=A0A8E2FC43_9PEZI|nr:hypothetical protein AOQ84DRAFT_359045 [Glonium stellatum]
MGVVGIVGVVCVVFPDASRRLHARNLLWTIDKSDSAEARELGNDDRQTDASRPSGVHGWKPGRSSRRTGDINIQTGMQLATTGLVCTEDAADMHCRWDKLDFCEGLRFPDPDANKCPQHTHTHARAYADEEHRTAALRLPSYCGNGHLVRSASIDFDRRRQFVRGRPGQPVIDGSEGT